MIIGHKEEQEAIRKILEKYERGAFILTGPEGIGKFYTLKILLKDFSFNDVIFFDSEENILKLQTAHLIQKLLSLSSENKRIIVVNDAHKLNKEAQNSLLKITEEIKTNALLFFVTHRPYKILPTIRSRMQKISFKLIPNEDIKNYLIAKGVKEQTINLVLKLFPGQIGKIINVIKNKEMFNLLAKIYSSKDDFEKIYNILISEDKIDLKEAIIYFMHIERLNLLNKDKSSIYKIKFLESLYQDSDYALNKTLQLSNVLLNING